jgi:phage gp29-like protein
VLTFWLRFAEKGPGTAAVRYPQGATDDEQKKALQAAEAVISKIAVAIPENFQLVEELLTAARSQNPAAYEKLHDRMQHAIARRILGQTLTSFGAEQGSGSRSLGQVHMDTFHGREVALAGALEDVINDQLVKRLVMWNYGPQAVETLLPKWTIDKENEDDLVQRSQVDERLQRMGVPIPKSYALKKYAIPELGAGDEELKPLQTTQLTQQSDSLVQGADSPTFGDARRAHDEQRDLDRLVEELQGEAFPIYKERVLDMVKPVVSQ